MEAANDPTRRRALDPTGRGLLAGGDHLGRALARWAADAAVDEAARERTRDRWRQARAAEEATVLGALHALAERGRRVGIDVDGERFRGRVIGLADDFLVLVTDQDQQVLIRSDAVAVVRDQPGGVAVRGDEPADVVPLSLAAALEPIAADRPTVVVRATGSDVPLRGELRSVGRDVLHVRIEGDPPTSAWVRTAAVTSIVLDP